MPDRRAVISDEDSARPNPPGTPSGGRRFKNDGSAPLGCGEIKALQTLSAHLDGIPTLGLLSRTKKLRIVSFSSKTGQIGKRLLFVDD